MKAPLFGRIAILGTGAIGASLAASISQHQIALHVAVHDLSKETRDLVLAKSYAHSAHETAAQAVKDAELVVLAAPPGALAALMSSIAPHLKQDCIVTDVTSVKREAIAAITPHLPTHAYFVPGHPIAGTERTGAEAADPNLFREKRIILTPTEEQVLGEPVARVRSMWEALEASTECMPPDLHDRIYAYVSHLPQLVAYAARPLIKTGTKASAGVLRLAQSSPTLWSGICFSNADYIHEAMEEFSIFLSQMTHELLENEHEAQDSPADNVPDPSSLLCSVIALCLVATALLLEQRTGVHASRYGGNGFKDMVAAAGNQSDSVLAAISSQPTKVAELLKATLDRLTAMGAALSVGNQGNFSKALAA